MPQVEPSDPQTSVQNTALFLECVTTFSHQAMMAMGKIVNPLTKKAERNLEVARFFIDTLEMLEAKTKGNLTKDEERFLASTLSSLRLTFVEETGRPDYQTPGEGPKPEDGGRKAESEPATEASDQPPAEKQNEEQSKKRFTKKYE